MSKTELRQHREKINSQLGNSNGGNKFCFDTACWHSRLDFGFEGNGTTSKKDNKSSNRTTGSNISSMGSVNVTNKLRQRVHRDHR